MGSARLAVTEGIEATSLVKAFWLGTPEHTAGTGEVLRYLKGHGVAERTGQRAIEGLERQGSIVKVKRGIWQLVR